MYGSKVVDPIAPFQDPYSDVSLFLSRKIKEISNTMHQSKDWSMYLQQKLLEKITPEFGKKFPHSRLGPAVLKKIWGKMSHLSELLEERGDALNAGKKLNLHFLIRENLKTALTQKWAQRKNNSFHPFLLAQQIALKVGESLATYEGLRPEVQQLTELVWAALKHLVPPVTQIQKALNTKDRLVVKWMIEILTQQPGIPYRELYPALQHKLKLFKELKEDIGPQINKLCIEWATKLLPCTTFFQTQSPEAARTMRAWLRTFDLSKNWQQLAQEVKTAAILNKCDISLYDLEILFWSSLKPLQNDPPSPLYDLLAQEAQLQLIHHPQRHWKATILQASHLLTKAREVSNMGNPAQWNHRIELWSCQGELILRWLDMPETPLLHIVRSLYLNNRSLKDPSATITLREQYLSQHQTPLVEPSSVHLVADLIRKYGWYHLASTSQDATFDRWVALHGTQAEAQKEFPLF
jgi:hypothetical protein